MLPPTFETTLVILFPALIGALLIGLMMQRAGRSPLTGAAIGGAAGAAGALLFMVPLNYCTFRPEAKAIDVFFGIALVSAGAAGMLFAARALVSMMTTVGLRRGLLASQTNSGAFRGWLLPWLFLAPTLIILALFLYYPAIDNFRLSTLLARLGTSRTVFVCVDNFTRLLQPTGFNTEALLLLAGIGLVFVGLRALPGLLARAGIEAEWAALLARYALLTLGAYLLVELLARVLAPDYYQTVIATFGISAAVVVIGLVLSLGIAYMAYQPVRGASIYRTLLIWPYAISPPVAGIIFSIIFNEQVGIANRSLELLGGTGLRWLQDSSLAPWTIIIASVWKSLGFSILFYIAGLQNVPKDMLEAASIDGANAVQRFMNIVIPMLSPITFFLIITNITYAFFDVFGTVDYLTRGGPVGATSVMIYRIYDLGIMQSDLGKAAAHSIVLFVLVIGITVLQFRTTGRRVSYGA